MNKELFVRYADIKNQIKALKEQENEVNKEVMAEMEKDGVVKAQSDFGTFSIVSSRTYKFGEVATKMIDGYKHEIQITEQAEIEAGNAEEIINNSLRYQNAKN